MTVVPRNRVPKRHEFRIEAVPPAVDRHMNMIGG